MKPSRVWIAMLCAAALVLPGCDALDPRVRPAAAGELPKDGVADGPVAPELVDAQNTLGFELLARLGPGEENVFVSPVSAASALLMTYGGAGGSTKEGMAEALGVSGLSDEQIDTGYANLLTTLMRKADGGELSIANAIWSEVPLKDGFLDRNARSYAAKLGENDPDVINEWVSERTGGRIEKLIDEDTPPASVHLVNATYFKADWSSPFDKGATTEEDFTLGDGSEKRVPLMLRAMPTRYFEDDSVQAVALPYARDGLAMYVLLPKAEDGVAALAEGLGKGGWKKVRDGLAERDGELRLPRFSLKTDHRFDEPLKALGMEEAFSPGADFSAMSGDGLWIGFVRQKTFLQVDETGTEAAAATDVGMVKGAMIDAPVVEPFEMRVDHPFVTAIVHEPTGAVLFVGAVTDPGKAE